MRNKNIDVLKGMAILFVIYYHILWAAVGYKASPTAVFFHSSCMQLFFFISGYLSFRLIGKEERRSYINKSIIKKVRYVLMPTILMFIFSIWYFHLDLCYWLGDDFKNGYWFTYVLFFVFILHYLIVLPLQSFEKRKWKDILIITITFMLMVNSRVFPNLINNDVVHLFSLRFVFYYWFYFTFGYFVSKYKETANYIVSLPIVRTIVFVLAIIPLHYFDEGFKRAMLESIVSPARVVVIFYLINEIRFFGENHIISNQLAKIGRHSLEIYFLHYYFLFGMPIVLKELTQQLDMYVVRGPGATFTLEIMIIVPIAVIIAYLCIFLRSIFNFTPPLSEILFGKMPKDWVW